MCEHLACPCLHGSCLIVRSCSWTPTSAAPRPSRSRSRCHVGPPQFTSDPHSPTPAPASASAAPNTPSSHYSFQNNQHRVSNVANPPPRHQAARPPLQARRSINDASRPLNPDPNRQRQPTPRSRYLLRYFGTYAQVQVPRCTPSHMTRGNPAAARLRSARSAAGCRFAPVEQPRGVLFGLSSKR